MHVIDSLQIGGAERMLVSLVNSVDPNRYKPSVCITRNGLTLANELNPDIPIIVLNRRSKLDVKGFIRLREFCSMEQVDLFHAHGRSTFQFLITAKFLGFINAPILLHDHFGDIEMDQRVPTWFRLLGPKFADYYVGVYEKLADWAQIAGVPKSHIAVIGNGIEMKRFQNIPKPDLHHYFQISPERKIGVMVGNLRPAKGLDLLIEALSRCQCETPPLMVIVGAIVDKDYVNKCQILMKQKHLENNFIFLGQQPNALSWINGADFGIMASRSESGPLVLIEMMACGLPVASFNVGNVSNVTSRYLKDSFANPEDIEQLSALIQELTKCSSENLLDRGRKAKQIAFQLFDIEQKLPQWYSIYETILGHA